MAGADRPRQWERLMNDTALTMIAVIIDLNDQLRAARAEIERLRKAAEPPKEQ